MALRPRSQQRLTPSSRSFSLASPKDSSAWVFVRGNQRFQPHARFFLFLERNPFAFWLVLVAIIVLLITLTTVSDDKEADSGTKVIFPVPGTITKCPISVDDAVKECHSEPYPPSVDILKPLREPGTFIIRFR